MIVPAVWCTCALSQLCQTRTELLEACAALGPQSQRQLLYVVIDADIFFTGRTRFVADITLTGRNKIR